MLTIDDLKIRTFRAISIVKEDFQRNPCLFLSEGDLQSRLFLEFSKQLPKEGMTGDGDHKTNYVHSQISYFEENKLNKNKVDLVVVNPDRFDFKNKQIIKRKGYCFREPSIVIELKLCKVRESLGGLLNRWREDLEKLKRLKIKRNDSIFISILFDKFNLIEESVINQLKTEFNGIEVMYHGICYV